VAELLQARPQLNAYLTGPARVSGHNKGVTAPRAWLIWTIGIFGYLVAVCQRTSFGVVGLEATERFHASASAISFFTVLQLLVYAGLQIPVGLLVDRFGSRAMIAGGAVLMGLGQLQLAFADSIPGGVAGRVLVGAGDAMTFISVIRLIPLWFAPARVPLVTQLTGMSGQLGQLFSVLPFAFVLHSAGWTPAFLMLAGMSGLAVVLVVLLLQDVPPGTARPQAPSGPEGHRRLAGARLAPAGHAAGHVEPLHHPVQRHCLRDDVGLPVPDFRRRAWTPEPLPA
jgi:MFS family permease